MCTHYLSQEALQYQFWLQKEQVFGWWNPPALLRKEGGFWTAIWRFIMKPRLKPRYERTLKERGWKGLFQDAEAHWKRMNHFPDLEGY